MKIRGFILYMSLLPMLAEGLANASAIENAERQFQEEIANCNSGAGQALKDLEYRRAAHMKATAFEPESAQAAQEELNAAQARYDASLETRQSNCKAVIQDVLARRRALFRQQAQAKRIPTIERSP